MTHSYPAITAPELLQSSALARRRDQWREQGIVFNSEDLPRLDELLAKGVASGAIAEGTPRVPAIRAAMNMLGAELVAAGVQRDLGPAILPDAVSPEPQTWADGTVLQRMAQTVLMELDEDAAVDAIGRWAEGGPTQRELTGLGYLYKEKEVAELLKVSLPTLRAWRQHRRHLEFVKFGMQGTVRYTERGIRAFFAAYTQKVDE